MGGFTSRLRPPKPKTPLGIVEAVPGDDASDCSSDTTSSWESVDETGYDLAWETLDDVFEAACAQLERQGWKRTVLDQRRIELEEAEAALSKEEQEAIEAEFAAAKEREEYEQAVILMEKVRAELVPVSEQGKHMLLKSQ